MCRPANAQTSNFAGLRNTTQVQHQRYCAILHRLLAAWQGFVADMGKRII